MSKKPEHKPINDQQEALEMIELAADDIDLLAEAFSIISEACAELGEEEEDSDSESCYPYESLQSTLVH